MRFNFLHIFFILFSYTLAGMDLQTNLDTTYIASLLRLRITHEEHYAFLVDTKKPNQNITELIEKMAALFAQREINARFLSRRRTNHSWYVCEQYLEGEPLIVYLSPIASQIQVFTAQAGRTFESIADVISTQYSVARKHIQQLS